MRRPGPILLACLLLSLAAKADARRCGDDVDGRAVPCDCGDLLVSSRTLGDADPITSGPCPGTALLVDVPRTRPAATLALGGYVLTGSRRGVGIQVLSGGEGGLTVVGPGAVRGFGTGLLAAPGGLARVSDVTAIENATDGFVVTGEGYAVTGCEALNNGRDGFALRGTGYRAEGNRALENARYGFVFAGRDGAIGETLGNEAAGNRRDGLRLRGRGHELLNPIATANGRLGISARLTRGRITGAGAASNRGRGIRAVGKDVTVAGSEAHGNGGGIDVRGARARDGGGNRAEDCRVGAPCR